MDTLTKFFKAMSDETRLRIIALLSNKAYCVCELSEILELSQPKISKHLSKLRDIGFVKTKREAQFIFYTLSLEEKPLNELLEVMLNNKKYYKTLEMDSKKTPTCTLNVGGKT